VLKTLEPLKYAGNWLITEPGMVISAGVKRVRETSNHGAIQV